MRARTGRGEDRRSGVDPAVVARVERLEADHSRVTKRQRRMIDRMQQEIMEVRRNCTCGAAEAAVRTAAGIEEIEREL